MPVLFPTFSNLAAELGDTMGRTLQKILNTLREVRVPVSGTALSSAARTATTITGDINCAGFKGIIVYLNVTAASGTGGLTARLFGVEPTTSAIATSAAASTAATTVGTRIFHFGPGVGTVNGATVAWGAAAVCLGSRFQIQVLHGDASSYTYSVTYELIP
jgi:hypothetical protein